MEAEVSQDAAPPQDPGPPPGVPAPGAAPQATGVPPEGQPAPKQGMNPKLKRALLGIVAAVVVFGVALWLGMDEPANAKVGDCVSGTSTEELQIVECDSPEAEWKVVGRGEDKARTEMESACQAFQNAERAYWEGREGQQGLVLCLASAK